MTNDLPGDETPEERSGGEEPPEKGSVLATLSEIEYDELAKYCESFEIGGVIAQSLTVKLREGQSLWASRGALMAYGAGIDWRLRIPGGASKAVSRMLSGEGIALTYVESERNGSEVVLTNNRPGKLVTWDLSRGAIVCTSGAFLAALGDVDISVTIARRAGAAFFGGGGLFMQRLSGDGIAVLHGSGDFLERQLAAGEKLVVSTGNLAVFSAEVDYSVRGVGGCRKMLFGGEGMFMTEMTGPGWVMLQTLKKQMGQQEAGAGS